MAPRNTRTGATATKRKPAAKSASRASSSSRSRSSASSRPAAKPRTASSAKRPSRTADPGRWWVLPVAALVVVAVFAWGYYPVVQVQYRETRERERLAAELESLQARNDRLRKQVERLKTPEGVEDYARSQLGMVKRGENVAVVVDEGSSAEASEALAAPTIDSANAAAQPVGPWTAFLDLVFGVQ